MIAGIRLPDWAGTRRLPVRLVLLMTLALFPLGVISLIQTGSVIAEARALNRASLMERTIAAGADQRDLIQHALGAAQGLGHGVGAVSQADCDAMLTAFVADHPSFVAAQYHGADGTAMCSSANASVLPAPGMDRMAIHVHAGADKDGARLILVNHPVDTGGAVSIAIPAALADTRLRATDEQDGLRIGIVNAQGALLAASHGPLEAGAYLSRDKATPDLLNQQGSTFDGIAINGNNRVFAVAPLISGQLVLVGSWPYDTGLGAAFGASALAPMILPVLMWFTGMGVAYFGLRRLVVRHIRALQAAMQRFAVGELRSGRLSLDNPPTELRQAERAFNRMVVLLARAEAQQEQDLRDKEVLLKEVHHRVKNNLQLIGSIINMQTRQTDNSEAQRMLRSLAIRVRGLAAMHRTVSDEPQTGTVDAAELVRTLVSDITGMSDATELAVETALDPVMLLPDQAVPLSMLVAETMTNAIKYCGTGPDGTVRITVKLRRDSGKTVTYSVSNTTDDCGDSDNSTAKGDGLGSRLIRAFQQQLGGQANTVAEAGTFTYEIAFFQRDFEAPAQPNAELRGTAAS